LTLGGAKRLSIESIDSKTRAFPRVSYIFFLRLVCSPQIGMGREKKSPSSTVLYFYSQKREIVAREMSYSRKSSPHAAPLSSASPISRMIFIPTPRTQQAGQSTACRPCMQGGRRRKTVATKRQGARQGGRCGKPLPGRQGGMPPPWQWRPTFLDGDGAKEVCVKGREKRRRRKNACKKRSEITKVCVYLRIKIGNMQIVKR